jgi:hypothetical protein
MLETKLPTLDLNELMVSALQHDFYPSKDLQYYNPVTVSAVVSGLGPNGLLVSLYNKVFFDGSQAASREVTL